MPLAGGVHLLPCTSELANTAAALVMQEGAEQRLRDVVALYHEHYDWVLIDTPPGLGPLSSLAMLAARWIIVPARPADFDIGGAVKVADLLEHEIVEFNPLPHLRERGSKVRGPGRLAHAAFVVSERDHVCHRTVVSSRAISGVVRQPPLASCRAY